VQQTAIEQQREQIVYEGLPLAIYREVAAHLRQVEGVNVELIPQTSRQFNYHQSQIGGLSIAYPMNLSDRDRQLIKAILDYYAQIHGSYQRF
jgi:hypothetical protein